MQNNAKQLFIILINYFLRGKLHLASDEAAGFKDKDKVAKTKI